MKRSFHPGRRQGGRGSALIYVLVAFVTLCAIVSFAVDFGRVQLVKSELRRTADAAALAGAAALSSGTISASNAAVQIAAANRADERNVVLNPATDVEFGTWDSSAKSFTTLSGSAANSANALRITTRRTNALGNAVKLTFAALIGMNTCDVSASAIAFRAPSGGGYIGLSLTRMYNTARFDGYNATSGAYSSGSALPGTLLSYKDLWLYDTSYVYGEAHWDLSGTFNHDASAIISPGPTSAQNLNNNFPAVTLNDEDTNNNNSNLTSYYSSNKLVIPDNKGTITYPGGTYYFTSFDLGKGNTVRFSGPTTIYLKCGGNLTCTLQPASLRPADLSVRVLPSYNWKIDTGGVFYGSFYNPTGDVHHHNGGISYGSVISDLLCFRQGSQGHQDMSLGKYAIANRVYLVR